MIRRESNTRAQFAFLQAEKWFKKMNQSASTGNLLTCKATKKFLKARKIYVHYCNEYQLKTNLKLMT